MRGHLEKGTPSPETTAFVGMFTKSIRSNMLHLLSRPHRVNIPLLFRLEAFWASSMTLEYVVLIPWKPGVLQRVGIFCSLTPQEALLTYTHCCTIGPLFSRLTTMTLGNRSYWRRWLLTYRNFHKLVLDPC